jgi:hypothetical protein
MPCRLGEGRQEKYPKTSIYTGKYAQICPDMLRYGYIYPNICQYHPKYSPHLSPLASIRQKKGHFCPFTSPLLYWIK